MKVKLADLHTHSYYSDGTMSPKEILKAALDNGVGLLSLTDHDVLEGTIELQKLCSNYDITYIPGIELDSLDQKDNIHILGYGIDLEDNNFRQFVQKNRALLDSVNSMLIEKMQYDYDCISYEEYNQYQYDRTKGGWKALHYLLDKGITKNLFQGFAYYTQYGCSYACVDFPSVETVCHYIHKAGGKAVLAHPGVTYKEENINLFKDKVMHLLDYGLDGIECYYPKHREEVTKACLAICRERDLLITTGSDCHGTFGNAAVGETKIPITQLYLKGLV